MGLTRPYQVKYANGQYGVAELIDCVNVSRTPLIREKIMNGVFHRIPSPDGKGFITIEKPFFYADFSRNHFLLVKPRFERHEWLDASAQLERMVKKIPGFLSASAKRNMRVVFGLGELREKLVADENGIDDKMVELLKVLVIYEHPFLIKRARLRIFLEKITENAFDFVACYDHNKSTFRIRMPRSITDTLLTEQRKEVIAWVKKRHINNNIFELKHDHWINFWRWSPITVALNSLKAYAKLLRKGENINIKEKEFTDMLKYLPRGSQLPSWAKKEMHELFSYAKKKKLGKLQDAFFEIRFDRELDDDWYKNDDPNDIDTLWKLLNDLPETNVEGNTEINEIILSETEDGGWYNPNTNDIGIGSEELYNKENFEDTVRHEVGHAVHEMHREMIDEWLNKRFGWMSFESNDRDIDAWVNQAGGYGEVNAQQKREIRGFLRQALGDGDSWKPPRRPAPPRNHPWWTKDFGPRLACEKSHEDWYTTNAQWYIKDGRAFFLNYYYKMFMVVNVEALTLINDGMPDPYAAMSPFEFFAELYALFYDTNDKKRKNIPKDVMAWLNANIGKGASAPKKKKPIVHSNKIKVSTKKRVKR